MRAWAEELLDPPRMAEEGWFDPAIVQRRWQDHLPAGAIRPPALWAVLMFQAWLREQKSADGARRPSADSAARQLDAAD